MFFLNFQLYAKSWPACGRTLPSAIRQKKSSSDFLSRRSRSVDGNFRIMRASLSLLEFAFRSQVASSLHTLRRRGDGDDKAESQKVSAAACFFASAVNFLDAGN